MKRSITLFALTVLSLSLIAGGARAQELFEFTGVSDGAAWNGAVDGPSNSGDYTLTGAGFLQELSNTLSMFQDPSMGGISAELQVLDLADVSQSFTVNSFDWRAVAANGGNTESLVGYSGGVGGTEEWRLNGPFDNDPPTMHTAPTTGSFMNQIDTILWDSPGYVSASFGHVLDNVSINVVPEPASLLLLSLAGLALAVRRSR